MFRKIASVLRSLQGGSKQQHTKQQNEAVTQPPSPSPSPRPHQQLQLDDDGQLVPPSPRSGGPRSRADSPLGRPMGIPGNPNGRGSLDMRVLPKPVQHAISFRKHKQRSEDLASASPLPSPSHPDGAHSPLSPDADLTPESEEYHDAQSPAVTPTAAAADAASSATADPAAAGTAQGGGIGGAGPGGLVLGELPNNNHPIDESKLGSCPPYAAKAVWGLRYTMEDKWTAVPNLLQLPSFITSPRKAPKRFLPESLRRGCCGVQSSWSDSKGDRQRLVSRTASERDGSVELDSLHFFAVYDGHGGAEAAKHCATSLHTHLTTQLTADGDGTGSPRGGGGGGSSNFTGSDASGGGGDLSQHGLVSATAKASSGQSKAGGSNAGFIEAALTRAFVNCDNEFEAISEGSYVGTTAVVVLLGSRHMWVAHAGDSRAVIARRGEAIALTLDHKAGRDDEVARVEAAGGHVWWGRVMGELAVSRAIGDHCLRPYVIPEPDTSTMERTPDDELLLLASDGLWDVINNQEAVDMALRALANADLLGETGVAACKRAAGVLAKAALDRGTRDNVTVLLVDLRAQAGGGGGGGSGTGRRNGSGMV